MAKFVRVCVTRTECVDLNIRVPDNFNNADLLTKAYKDEIERITIEGTDDWSWKNNVKIKSVADMDKEDAEKYGWGELKVVDA